jgi:hypothetical protein
MIAGVFDASLCACGVQAEREVRRVKSVECYRGYGVDYVIDDGGYRWKQDPPTRPKVEV